MATRTLKASVAPIRLIPGMQLRLEAIDATSGAAVTGVTATRWAIYGDTEDDETGDTSSGPFMFVPGPTPVGNPGDGVKITGGL